MVPDGVTFSVRHFLNIPNSSEIRELLESETDKHYVIKVTKVNDRYQIKKFREYKEIASHYFKTDAFQREKLCHLTTASLPECKHGSMQRYTLTKMKTECPHKKGTVALYVHCDADISESEFLKEKN